MPESLSGLYSVWPFSSVRPNSSEAAAQGCLLLCHSGRASGEVENVPALGTEQTPAGIPKSLPASWPHLPGACQVCEPNRIAHAPPHGECQDAAAQLQEQHLLQ